MLLGSGTLLPSSLYFPYSSLQEIKASIMEEKKGKIDYCDPNYGTTVYYRGRCRMSFVFIVWMQIATAEDGAFKGAKFL